MGENVSMETLEQERVWRGVGSEEEQEHKQEEEKKKQEKKETEQRCAWEY